MTLLVLSEKEPEKEGIKDHGYLSTPLTRTSYIYYPCVCNCVYYIYFHPYSINPSSGSQRT